MPRDVTAFVEATPDLTVPSLEGLAYLLRHRELWPEGFEWAFDDCKTCAMGLLARKMGWDLSDSVNEFVKLMASSLSMPHHAAYEIFCEADHEDFDAVTPDIVALRIEFYLADAQRPSPWLRLPTATTCASPSPSPAPTASRANTRPILRHLLMRLRSALRPSAWKSSLRTPRSS